MKFSCEISNVRIGLVGSTRFCIQVPVANGTWQSTSLNARLTSISNGLLQTAMRVRCRNVKADGVTEVVRAYEEAYNNHDAKAINRLYALDARFHIEGIMAIEGKQVLAGRTDYDIELHTHIHIDPISTHGNKLRALVTESNEWLREVGIRTAEYESEFEVDNGKITSIVAKPSRQQAAQSCKRWMISPSGD